MSGLQYTEKFIAFFDVLGWKYLVRASEEGRGLSLRELSEILAALGTADDREHFEKYGPTICPEAPRIRKDMDFRISSASDSVLISAEVSPAGLINLVSHCCTACFKLMSKGVMCRGYIKRSLIYHTPGQQIGTGLSDVVERAGRTWCQSKTRLENGRTRKRRPTKSPSRIGPFFFSRFPLPVSSRSIWLAAGTWFHSIPQSIRDLRPGFRFFC